jgi:Firmicute plasmid replication protein (RepL)
VIYPWEFIKIADSDNKYIFRSFHVVNNEIENSMLEFIQPNAKMKVWDYLTRNMVGWNKITVPQSQLSKELGITRQHLSRTLKYFEENLLIIKSGKNQSNNIYMLNPLKVWNGSAEDHAKANALFCELRDRKKQVVPTKSDQ